MYLHLKASFVNHILLVLSMYVVHVKCKEIYLFIVVTLV
jgi:hypothetical protein